jgi:carbonic anhydrase
MLFSRRNVLKISAGAAGAGVLSAGLHSQITAPARADVAIPTEDLTPEQALQRLVDGNQRFVENRRQNPNQTLARLEEVAQRQSPFASILGCADSRVPSEIIFDQGLGDLFVCRVAGNVATPEEIGSLEFGSAVLGTKVILVLGHERCGAVDATLQGVQVPGQIGSLLEAIQPAVEQTNGQPGDPLENACKANVLLQIDRLKASPVLSQLIQDNKLNIVGGYYDLDTGVVTLI